MGQQNNRSAIFQYFLNGRKGFPNSCIIRDFKGINDKGFDGRGNYTLGVTEQIIFPEINIDQINKIMGMDITFVTTAKTDIEALELLKQFGLPFKNQNTINQ